MKSEKPEKPAPKPALKIAPPPDVQAPKARTAGAGMFSIDSDIPIPRDVTVGQKAGYPYKDLEVGESFWVPNPTYGVQNKIKGRHFITREWTQGGVKGRRVWRVK